MSHLLLQPSSPAAPGQRWRQPLVIIRELASAPPLPQPPTTHAHPAHASLWPTEEPREVCVIFYGTIKISWQRGDGRWAFEKHTWHTLMNDASPAVGGSGWGILPLTFSDVSVSIVLCFHSVEIDQKLQEIMRQTGYLKIDGQVRSHWNVLVIQLLWNLHFPSSQ